MSSYLHLIRVATIVEGEEKSQQPYAQLVGSLLYLAGCMRPDIAQAVGALSRHVAQPTAEHWAAAKDLLRYVKGTAAQGISYGEKEGVVGYGDDDFVGCLDTRKSTTGVVFLLHGGAVAWASRVQPTVASPTTEAEYMAGAAATREALWLKRLLSE
jgi:hypothetical protein